MSPIRPAKRHAIVEEDLAQIYGSHLPLERMAGKTVLVTGASGFLAAYMVETLLYANEQSGLDPIRVIAMMRNLEKGFTRFQAYSNRSDLQIVQQDVSQRFTWDGPVAFVIHAASQASPMYFRTDPIGTSLPNVLGTHFLLELAQQKNSEAFLFFSSAEVYGTVSDDLIPTVESTLGYLDPSEFRSCYGESKRMGENLCASWAHQFGVPAKIVRPTHTYGPGMGFNDGRVFCDFVGAAVEGRDLIVKSDGRATRTFCYLADAVEGFFKVLFFGKAGVPYNVGSDTPEIGIGELAEIISGLIPEKKLKVAYRPEEREPNYLASPVLRMCPNIDRIKALGWKPKCSIENGFRRTILSYAEVS